MPVVEHSAAGAKRAGRRLLERDRALDCTESSAHASAPGAWSSGCSGSAPRCFGSGRPSSGHPGLGELSLSDPRWRCWPGLPAGSISFTQTGASDVRARLRDRGILPPPCAAPLAARVERRALPPDPDTAPRRAGPALLRAAPSRRRPGEDRRARRQRHRWSRPRASARGASTTSWPSPAGRPGQREGIHVGGGRRDGRPVPAAGPGRSRRRLLPRALAGHRRLRGARPSRGRDHGAGGGASGVCAS